MDRSTSKFEKLVAFTACLSHTKVFLSGFCIYFVMIMLGGFCIIYFVMIMLGG